MAATRRQVPLAVRVPREQMDWLARESRGRDIERSALVREMFEDWRTCFGLPPADRDVLQSEAARERLDLRRFVAEVLREKARELRAAATAVSNETAREEPAFGTTAANGRPS